MKILFKIAFILLAPLLITAMEEQKPYKNTRPRNQLRLEEYITVDNSIIKKRLGPRPEYFKEYHAENPDDNLSFPIRSCDPLKVQNVGNARFFITSALNGNIQIPGMMIKIESDLDKVVAIRFKTGGVLVTHLYIGYNSLNSVVTDNKRIYEGQLLISVTKNTKKVDEAQIIRFEGIRPLSACVLGEYAREEVPTVKDYDWNSIPFQEALKERYNRPGNVPDCYLITNPSLGVCYWDFNGNKLKGIKYNHQHNK